jgi:hypothetical protein
MENKDIIRWLRTLKATLTYELAKGNTRIANNYAQAVEKAILIIESIDKQRIEPIVIRSNKDE